MITLPGQPYGLLRYDLSSGIILEYLAGYNFKRISLGDNEIFITTMSQTFSINLNTYTISLWSSNSYTSIATTPDGKLAFSIAGSCDVYMPSSAVNYVGKSVKNC